MAKSSQENSAEMPDKEDTAHHFGLTMRPVAEREEVNDQEIIIISTDIESPTLRSRTSDRGEGQSPKDADSDK